MKKVTALLMSVCFITVMAYGQNEKESFKPSGKVFMRIFSNFHSTFSDGASASAFELNRAYLGYDYALSENFKGQINIDIANPGNGSALEMTAYIKNAYISYTKEKLSASFGLISTTQFSEQEKWWANRYVEKSFQDAYKIGSSADLGIKAAYNFTDWLSADVIIVNGEGYKKLQADKYYKSGVGITLNPVKKLTARGYFDFMGNNETQTTLMGFLGYDFGKATIGAEYNLQNNMGYTANKNLSGFSAYTNVSLFKNMKVYGRYDYLTSNTLDGATSNWNLSNDGNLVIAGIEFQPVKGLKISPNYRLWNPADGTKKPMNSFFLSCDIKF